jgi:hypothetical protein
MTRTRLVLALALAACTMQVPAIAQVAARSATTAASMPASAGARTAAVADDPLRSDACRRALDALQSRESSERSPAQAQPAADADATNETQGPRRDARAPRAPDPQLEALRHQAAIACLANRPDPERRARPQAPASRFAQPPLAVPPVTLAAPPATALPHPVPLTPIVPTSPQAGPRPQFITSCDAGGCWANDGSRLNRVGPNLSAGSRGLCVQQGNLLSCP